MNRKYPGLWTDVEWALCPSIAPLGGGILPDLTGNGHDGTTFGTVTQDAIHGKYMVNMSENDCCIDIADSQSWAPAEFTLSFWFYGGNAGDQYMYCRNQSGTNIGSVGIYNAAFLSPDRPRGFVKNSGGTSLPAWNSNGNNNVLYHCVLRNHVTDGAVLFRDGVKQTTTTGAYRAVDAHANYGFTIGWSGTGHSDTHGADSAHRMDDCVAWNRALSDDEIMLLYQLGPGGWHARRSRPTVIFFGAEAEFDPTGMVDAMTMESPRHLPLWKAVSYT